MKINIYIVSSTFLITLALFVIGQLHSQKQQRMETILDCAQEKREKYIDEVWKYTGSMPAVPARYNEIFWNECSEEVQ